MSRQKWGINWREEIGGQEFEAWLMYLFPLQLFTMEARRMNGTEAIKKYAQEGACLSINVS